MIAVSEFLTEW